MQNIDFLPDRYREREQKRKAAIWQYGLFLMLGAMLLAASLGQFAIKRSLQTSLDDLSESRLTTQSKRERVTLLKRQLGSSEERAELYTYLRHPWPRTQLIGKITASLPENIVLESIEIIEEHRSQTPFSNPETLDDTTKEAPAAADLAQLRNEHDSSQLIIRVRGSVDDTATLNTYVRQLGEVKLFRSVSLGSLQSQATTDNTILSEFEINVVVRPGHGQPNGPSDPLLRRNEIARLTRSMLE
jgi:Tfp pilus assembly protein PilN